MFVRKTTDSILSAFNKMLNDLQEVASRETQTAEQRDQDARTAQAEATAARAEAARARNVAERIQRLVGDSDAGTLEVGLAPVATGTN